MLERAPLYEDVADAPSGGAAYWVAARDGVRLRIGGWGGAAPNGTVLLFPGRTEYIEKYGRAARDLAACGYATLTIDWRGQGLSDRLTPDEMAGHVGHFADYQADVAAMLSTAEALNLPRPWHLLAHSMGGCIGLRALMNGLPVASVAFSAPMWGIRMSETVRPVAWSLSWSSRHLRMDHHYAPGTTANESYVLAEPFETNKLTNDPEMYQYMVDQTRAYPALGLGGPSLRWLHEALKECRDLSKRPSPDLPAIVFAGTDEDIVDLARIRARVAAWPGTDLHMIDGGRHEVLMECPAIRNRVFKQICGFFHTMGAHAPNGNAPDAATGI